VHYGIAAPNFESPGRLIDLAVAAERHGWDGFFLWDHVHRDGDPPPPLADTWITLGAAATQTSRIQLGSWVTPVPRRRPHVLARQVVTVDHLSGGRVILGVGLGSQGAGALGEFARFGENADVRRRAVLLDEGLEAMVGLFSGKRFSFHGSLVNVEKALFLPRPVRGHLPVWVACEWPHRSPLRRAARYDGVVPIKIVDGEYGFMTPEDVDQLRRVIQSLRAQSPRDDRFEIAVLPGPRPRASTADFEAAGATWLLASSAGGVGWDDELENLIRFGPTAMSK